MKTLRPCLSFLGILMAISSFGQANIHLHTNKDGYTAGESVWFSTYMADSLSGRLRQNAEPMFVQLFAPDGKKTTEQIIFMQGGRGFGTLKLDKALNGGIYRLRAFTRAMYPNGYEKQVIVKNMGDEKQAYSSPPPAKEIAWLQPLKINIGVEKYFFKPREQINVKIRVTTNQGDPIQGTFSMSVSELMTVGAQESYTVLNEIRPINEAVQPKAEDKGLVYEGRIVNEKTGVGIPNASLVVIAVGTANRFTRTTVADAKGDFKFEDMPVVGEQEVSYQINNKKGDVVEGATVAWKPFIPNYELPALTYEQVAMTEAQKEKQLQNIQRPDGELGEDKTVQLEEIEIKTKQDNLDTRGIIKLHAFADAKVEFDPRYPKNMDIYDMIGMLPGVQSSSGARTVLIGGFGTLGASTVPLFLVDGMAMAGGVPELGLNTNDIVRIEKLTGANAAIYGSNGGNGVIAIYTRRHKKNEIIAKSKGDILKGYDLSKPFYFPDYSQPPTEASKEADNRLTLYWNPEIITDPNGEAVVSFYASDIVGNFKIMVEGMSVDNVGVANKLIRVDAKK
jgi:TonB-dependent Receptor Plug Domain